MNQSEKLKLPPEIIKSLSRRSDWKGGIQAVAHLLLLSLTSMAISNSFDTFWLYPALLIHGIVLTFLFSALHETIHYTAFKTRWLNNSLAAISGFLLLLPFQYFRAFHMAHHRYTQNPLKDPEHIGEKTKTRVQYWKKVSGYSIWKDAIQTLFQHAMGNVSSSFIDEHKHQSIILEARIHLVLYLLILLFSLLSGNGFIWWYWLLPALLGQPALRLFLMAEHSGCDESDDMLENSRTTYSAPIVNFLSWNMAFHAEHHYLASTPFHALPALHAYTGQQVKYRSTGYWQFNREYYHSLN